MEQEILDLIKTDAEKGLSLLIDRYGGLVYTVVKNKMSYACSAEDIEETVSDVFVTLYNSLDSIDLSKGTLEAFLVTLAKRRAVDRLRRENKPIALSFEDAEEFIEIPDSVNLENEVERKLLYERLGGTIRSLGEPDSTIVYRKYWLGEDSVAIAQFTGLTSDNVRQRLSRALRKIKRLMEDYYEI